VAELTYREAVAAGIAQEMERDERVVFLGEDVPRRAACSRRPSGLLERFGPRRVRDTPISEQAIIGAAMGAAMTGLRPSPRSCSRLPRRLLGHDRERDRQARYHVGRPDTLPRHPHRQRLGRAFGAQHSQSVRNWAMSVPGLKVVAPSNPADVKGLLAAAVRDPDPVVFFEHKGLYATKARSRTASTSTGSAPRRCCARAATSPWSRSPPWCRGRWEAAERLQREDGISATWSDVRSLVPLDTKTILAETIKTGRLYTVEETRACAAGARRSPPSPPRSASTTSTDHRPHHDAHVPLPAADALEDGTVPSVARIVETIRRTAG